MPNAPTPPRSLQSRLKDHAEKRGHASQEGIIADACGAMEEAIRLLDLWKSKSTAAGAASIHLRSAMNNLKYLQKVQP